jgi:hypothetical protein
MPWRLAVPMTEPTAANKIAPADDILGVTKRNGGTEPGAARIHDGLQGLRGLHLLEPILGFNAGVTHFQHSRLGKWGSDLRYRPFDLIGALQGADRSDLRGQRPEQA